jgi:hypothetical protein
MYGVAVQMPSVEEFADSPSLFNGTTRPAESSRHRRVPILRTVVIALVRRVASGSRTIKDARPMTTRYTSWPNDGRVRNAQEVNRRWSTTWRGATANRRCLRGYRTNRGQLARSRRACGAARPSPFQTSGRRRHRRGGAGDERRIPNWRDRNSAGDARGGRNGASATAWRPLYSPARADAAGRGALHGTAEHAAGKGSGSADGSGRRSANGPPDARWTAASNTVSLTGRRRRRLRSA